MMPNPLVHVVQGIDMLCQNGHLAWPGTIILSADRATIMVESRTPISTLLIWTEHLDSQTPIEFEATQLSPGLIGVNATGALDGVRVTVSATTTAPFPPAENAWAPVPVTAMAVLELSLCNEVI